MKDKQQASYVLPSSIQKIFVWSIIGLYALQFGYFLWQGIVTYQSSPHIGNFTGYYGYLFTSQLLPIVLFIIAYFMNPRKLSVVKRAFESLLLTLVAATAWSLISIAIPFFLMRFGQHYMESYANYEVISSGVLIALYVFGLVWLRSSKRWA